MVSFVFCTFFSFVYLYIIVGSILPQTLQASLLSRGAIFTLCSSDWRRPLWESKRTNQISVESSSLLCLSSGDLVFLSARVSHFYYRTIFVLSVLWYFPFSMWSLLVFLHHFLNSFFCVLVYFYRIYPSSTFQAALISRDAIFSVCSHTYILFWLTKTSARVETYQLNFLVL